MSKKTVYPYTEARQNSYAIFRSRLKPTSIYNAVYAYSKRKGERFKVTKEDAGDENVAPLYRLEFVIPE